MRVRGDDSRHGRQTVPGDIRCKLFSWRRVRSAETNASTHRNLYAASVKSFYQMPKN